MSDFPDEQWQSWMDNPLAVDQLQGFTHEETSLFVTQTKLPTGEWVAFGTPRADRDEVTRHQAFHINTKPEEPVRVWRRDVSWQLVEVPGDGEGQTPIAEILARNEEIQKRLLEEKTEQPE